MSARALRRAAVIALFTIMWPWQAPLQSQPSTEGLADATTRQTYGLDIGGTAGPLSLFQQPHPADGQIESAVMISYLISARDSYPIRVVAGFYQSQESLAYGGAGSIRSSDRITTRFVSIGALVDMVDHSLGRGRFGNVRFVTAFGVGVAPYVTTQVTCALCGADYSQNMQGAGAEFLGSVGLRWKRLAIDYQPLYLLATGNGISSRLAAPFTMGVRF